MNTVEDFVDLVNQDRTLIKRSMDAVTKLEQSSDDLWPFFLSQEDISTLFFALGYAHAGGAVTRDGVNRIGQRLSKDFIPYEGAVGIDSVGLDRGGELAQTEDGRSTRPASTEGDWYGQDSQDR